MPSLPYLLATTIGDPSIQKCIVPLPMVTCLEVGLGLQLKEVLVSIVTRTEVLCSVCRWKAKQQAHNHSLRVRYCLCCPMYCII
jgi:hypothetical protein